LQAKPGQSAFYRPELDSLRFFAFLYVFISHAFSITTDYYTARGMPPQAALWLSKSVAVGGFGVALFFVLSSYLITELLIREHRQSGKLDVKSFYVRRALRIWPLYFFFLILVYLVIRQTSVYALPGKFLLPMFLLVGNWAVVFYNGMGYSVAGPFWSISVEEQFYLVWPLVIARFGVKHLKRICVATIILGNVSRLIMEKNGAGFIAFWCSTFTWLDAIAAGALVSVLLRGRAPYRSFRQRCFLITGGLVLWIVLARVTSFLVYPDVVGYPLIVAGSVRILLGFLGSGIANPILVYLGRISYGLYVWHVLALALITRLFPKYSFLNALAGLALTILIASISYRWLEEPFLRLKKRFTHVRSRPVELTATLAASAKQDLTC
jgi:peptidoglycan/LPS O-acetylase OafA/YrhL